MIKDVHHSSLFVANLDRSLEFYCGTLDLELVSRSDGWGGEFLGVVCGMPSVDMRINIALVRVGSRGKVIELIEVLHPERLQSDASTRPSGIARLGFEVDDIVGTVGELRARGVTFLSDIVTVAVAEQGHYSDGKAVMFLDVDGIILELQQPSAPGKIT